MTCGSVLVLWEKLPYDAGNCIIPKNKSVYKLIFLSSFKYESAKTMQNFKTSHKGEFLLKNKELMQE